MYETFFGFREKPFTLLPDPAYLYLSRQHRLALVHLEYGLLHRAGFIVISGEIGTGKTTLIKALLQRLDNQTEVASIFNTTVKPEEFLDLVLQEFELEYSGISRTDKLNRLNRDKLAHPSLVQLAQRVAVHYHLAPLTEEETSNYIRHRLEVASDKKEIEDLFTDDAIKAIYRHSKGTPRLINILCDSCLVYAFADEIMTIDGEMVEDTVKSQEASGFSALATAGTPFPDKLDTATLKTVSAESFENESLRALGIKVSELQSGLVTLNRLVQENLLSGQKSTSSTSQDLTDLELVIERQNSEIERLTEERKDLLKRIDRLTARNSEQETGDQDNKKRKENRVAGNPDSSSSLAEGRDTLSRDSENWFLKKPLKHWYVYLVLCVMSLSFALYWHGPLRESVLESWDKIFIALK
jgi:type II secretory pathway predicted ATPase ExeA